MELRAHGSEPPEWRDIVDPDQGMGGMAAVLVARRHGSRRVSVCGYLVDTHCLGLKDVLGQRVLTDRDLPKFVQRYFLAYEEVGRPLRAPLELAQHLVHGGIEAARRLGFEPHPDFPDVADHLGSWQGDCAITFGKDGAPYYVAGPYDDAHFVIHTLSETVGAGNFTFIAPAGAARRQTRIIRELVRACGPFVLARRRRGPGAGWLSLVVVGSLSVL